MSAQFPIEMFAGDHYCKLLTPFKAIEWIYVDSLYYANGNKRPSSSGFILSDALKTGRE